MTLPALSETNVTMHSPLAFVKLPVQLSLIITALAPLELVNVTVTTSPLAGCPVDEPLYSVTVTVKVCSVPTSFVYVDKIPMVASTHVFTASLLLPAVPSVSR